MALKMAKKVFIYIVVSVLAAAIVFYGWKLYKKYSFVEADIDMVEITKGEMSVTFQDIGDIYPKNIVEVRALVSGELTEILKQEGDSVKKTEKVAVVLPGQSAADKFMPVDVLSPISGTVFKCSGQGYNDEPEIKKAGERVSGASEYNPTCIMRVADMSKMIVKLEVSEAEIVKIKKNMPVDILIDTSGQSFKGKVSSISPNAEKDRMNVKSFPVEIEVIGHTNILPGMTARIMAVLQTKKDILLLPIAGLFDDKGKNFVYLYDAKTRKAKKTYIKCGLRNEMDIEILSGLKEGDKVYTDKPLNVEK